MVNALDQMMRTAMAQRFSRRGFLKGPVVAGAGALAFGALGGIGTVLAAAAPLDSDLDILNYALTLEHLEAAAYKAINDARVLTGTAATYFMAFGQHETAHVDAVTATIQKLGGTPVAAQQYNFSSVPKDQAGIVKFFQNVESVGASAYLGAAPSIMNPDVLNAALSIHAIEAEHTSALASLVAPGTDLFAPEAFATPRTPAQVMQIVAPFFMTGTSVPSGPPRTGGGGESAFIRRLGDG